MYLWKPVGLILWQTLRAACGKWEENHTEVKQSETGFNGLRLTHPRAQIQSSDCIQTESEDSSCVDTKVQTQVEADT